MIRQVQSVRVFRDVKSFFIALAPYALAGAVPGIILAYFAPLLRNYSDIVVLIPLMAGMRGNIYGSLCSRITTGLHEGTLAPRFSSQRMIIDNLAIVFSSVIILTSFFAAAVSLMIVGPSVESLLRTLFVYHFASIVSFAILAPAAFYISFKSYIAGVNPDHVTAPLITMLGDLTTYALVVAGLLIYLRAVVAIGRAGVAVIVFVVLMSSILVFYTRVSKPRVRRIFAESFSVNFLAACISIISGQALAAVVARFVEFPAIVAIAPVLAGLNGAAISILSSSIATNLHLGHRVGRMTVSYTYQLMAVLAAVYTIPTALVNAVFHMAVNPVVLYLIALLTGAVSIPIAAIVTYVLACVSFRYGIDPDNVLIPIMTTFMDALTLISLYLVANILSPI